MNTNNQEIEVKFYVADLDRVRRRILELKGELIQPRVLEINLRFDTPDSALQRGFQVLRLRQDTRARLTYKGPASGEQGVRVRKEIEFEVSDFAAARSFLSELGYQVSLVYEKYRTAYHFRGTEIVLDELPYGAFVEIEGPDSTTIAEVNRDLGLDWEAGIPSSYTSLFESLRQRLNLAFRDLIFENFVGIVVTPEMLGVRPADVPFD